MATLFFSRDGKDPNRAESKAELSMATVMQFFQKYDHHYFADPPGINTHKEPSPYSAYTNVVVEIENNEINEKFTKAGFYWFPQLQPNDCKELINRHELG
ncbi:MULTISPECIES: hypothetical protein [Geobacter]|uniref:hypothetical protein n=1 Tax=Geobacter TaxID=28231 RepID=UPI002573D4F2|nr:hypothetical protein [Geobacter sulfurreducens]BEH09084.1 hypothetical protein GSUET_06960 [Geobacter sulfurreducens subsp. ethanolicus]BET56974.1 hypothetical protein GEO60473_00140 [Geobacter sp. 60473]